MLSMKTLRVAIVAMGSALTFGSGLAAAQGTPIQLDGSGALAPSPIMIATQTIPVDSASKTPVAGSAAMYHNITLDDSTATVQITPRTALDTDDGFYLRVALGGGMIFRGDANAAISAHELVQGGAEYSQAVYRLADVAVDAHIAMTVTDLFAIASNSVADYTMSMSIHNEQFDAIDGVGAVRSIGAQDVVVVRAVSGIDARIMPKNQVADVATGFLWFVGGGDSPNSSGVEFGTANAMALAATGGVRDAGAGPDSSSAPGANVTSGDLINATGVTIGISGDFSVGVFDVIPAMMEDPNDSQQMVARPCPTHVGSAGSPIMANAGNLKPNERDPGTRMAAGLAPGAYKLCMEVDLGGPMSNTMPIPATDYTATVYTRTTTDPRDNMMASEASIGKITRNGASVRVGFLTTADKYNQRLIVVNHNQSRAVAITNIEVNVQDDVEDFEVMGDPAELVIGPGEMKVYLVKDVLEIMGRNRASGTLSFNGVASDISVATTIVNREDGSTDTVMWPVD